jgi:hypothetical protein
MIRTRETIYIEVIVEEITIVKISGETFIEIALKKAVFRVVDLIIDIVYYHRSFNKRSTIYMGSLNAN